MRICICGESYSLRQGWVEGALETSQEVIDRINDIKKNKKSKTKKQNAGGKKTKKLKIYQKSS